MKRKIIKIDEEKCTGCSQCIPNCPEGALQIIDGKARMVSELSCDGLGACIGHCPEGAMSIEEREAEAYDEIKVMENIVKAGDNTIKAHLKHLKDHGQGEYLQQALGYLKEKGIDVTPEKNEPSSGHHHGHGHAGCPGGRMIDRTNASSQAQSPSPTASVPSELRQWPVQLTLLNPNAPYCKNADILVAADCVPFAYGNFHQRFLKDKILVIFCPKLDADTESYINKLATIFQDNEIQSVTVARMEVPCCGGTTAIVQEALKRSGKNILVKEYTLSLSGEII